MSDDATEVSETPSPRPSQIVRTEDGRGGVGIVDSSTFSPGVEEASTSAVASIHPDRPEVLTGDAGPYKPEHAATKKDNGKDEKKRPASKATTPGATSIHPDRPEVLNGDAGPYVPSEYAAKKDNGKDEKKRPATKATTPGATSIHPDRPEVLTGNAGPSIPSEYAAKEDYGDDEKKRPATKASKPGAASILPDRPEVLTGDAGPYKPAYAATKDYGDDEKKRPANAAAASILPDRPEVLTGDAGPISAYAAAGPISAYAANTKDYGDDEKKRSAKSAMASAASILPDRPEVLPGDDRPWKAADNRERDEATKRKMRNDLRGNGEEPRAVIPGHQDTQAAAGGDEARNTPSPPPPRIEREIEGDIEEAMTVASARPPVVEDAGEDDPAETAFEAFLAEDMPVRPAIGARRQSIREVTTVEAVANKDDGGGKPWWKRHRKPAGIVCVLLVGVAVALGVTLGLPGDPEEPVKAIKRAGEVDEKVPDEEITVPPIEVIQTPVPTLSPTQSPTQSPTYFAIPSDCASATFYEEAALLPEGCDDCSTAVAIDGNHAVVASDSTVHFFVRRPISSGGWEKTFTKTFADTAVLAPAVSGDVAVVGAYGEDGPSGVAYVFERAPQSDGEKREWKRGWKLTDTLRHPGESEGEVEVETMSNAYFGRSVAVDGDVIVVGAYGSNSAHIFRRNPATQSWDPEVLLSPSPTTEGGGAVAFGHDVAVRGGVLAVSDIFYGGEEGTEGSVFVYDRDPRSGAWEPATVSRISGNGCDGLFGSGLAVADDGSITAGCAVTGGSPDSGGGAVHHYVRAGDDSSGEYALEQTIDAPGDRFGFKDRIAIRGNVMVMGTGSGCVSVYTRPSSDDKWSNIKNITAPEIKDITAPEIKSIIVPDVVESFGDFVAFSGDHVIVGSDSNAYVVTLGGC